MTEGTMREYINNVIHDEPNLVIGDNGRSILFGQGNNWVIIDKKDISKITHHIKYHEPTKKFDGFGIDFVSNSGILLKQNEDCVRISAGLFLEKLS